MMRDALLLSVLILSVHSCRSVPKVEACVVGDSDLFICNDPRLDEPDYDLLYPNDVMNYVCTNPDDYATMREYVLELQKELKKCENSR